MQSIIYNRSRLIHRVDARKVNRRYTKQTTICKLISYTSMTGTSRNEYSNYVLFICLLFLLTTFFCFILFMMVFIGLEGFVCYTHIEVTDYRARRRRFIRLGVY